MNSTICAISTAVGSGAISIIRVSGKQAISIVNSVFSGKDLTSALSHTIHYGFIKDQEEKIDEVLVSVFKAPKTFTTEDTVEINCHGGISPTNKILEILLRKGAKLAEPGEFTKRAFLNGRIDLLEAEAVSDMINSETEKSRKLAIKQLDGKLTKKIQNIRQKLISAQASLEVNIDYPEYQDIEVMTQKTLTSILNSISDELNILIKESINGKIIKNGIDVAILGEPNVGKSSLLNELIGEDKAIVTNIAGTTRDVVEAKVNINGILLNLHDTAGIRESEDKVEQIGVEKSFQISRKSDLIIYVIDNEIGITEENIKHLDDLTSTKVIILINKNDIKTNNDYSKLNKYNFEIVKGNTINPDGLNELKEKIEEMFEINKLETKDFTYLSSARQISLAKEARDSIEEGIETLKIDVPLDLLSININEAYRLLGEMIGEEYKSDLLDELFSRFCLGK